MMLQSVLMAYGIPHFVHNDHFGSLLVGPVIPLVNAKAIYVDLDGAEEASAVVADYLASTGGFDYHPTIADKIRVVIEWWFMHWIVIGSLGRKYTVDDEGG